MTEVGDAGPDAGVGTAGSVGEELARARAALGFSVADVAQQLKFASRQIEALEQGRFGELPTGTFARGMVRAYARLLKLDAEPLVQRIAAQTATPDNAAAVASVRRPIPITDSARRTNLIYAALSLAILVVIAGVVFEWQRERAGAAKLTFVPAAAQAPQQPAQAPVQSVQEPERTTMASAVATPNLAPMSQPEAPASAAARPVSPQAAGGSKRISMKFERTSWVEIRGGDGKVLTSQLNAGGTEQTVEGRPPFALVIGNAQHVRLSYDDRPIDLAPHVKVEVARFTLD
jgi:cytoskeleton protein RodZ